MGSGELAADASTAEPFDGFQVQALSHLAVAEQRPRPRLESERPVGAAGSCHLGEPLQGVVRPFTSPRTGGGLEHFDESHSRDRQALAFRRVACRGCRQRFLVPAQAVAEHRPRIVGEGGSGALAM
jgi:hypothetical protein